MHDRRGRELGGELRDRAQMAEVVERARRRRRSCRRRGSRRARSLDSTAPTATAQRDARRAKPAKMPTPPNVGVGRSCQRSPVGTATSRCAERRAQERPEDEAATGRAAIVTAALTPRKGSAIGLHAVGRRRSGTSPLQSPVAVYADLYPLPRAVREPLPARPAREVQGLGARPRSGRSRCPLTLMLVYLVVFSVLWKVADDGRRRLLAVPPLRAAALGVLRHLAAVVGAQPARERQPDPQGALPAPARAALDRRHAARRLRGDDRRRARARDGRPAGLAGDGVARDPDRRA